MTGTATEQTGDAERRVTFRDVLAIREFRGIYLAQTLSSVGDQLAAIAVAWIVFAKTDSAFLTAISFAVTYLPWIVAGPILSVYADRISRRQILIVSDLARAGIVMFMAIPHLPIAALLVLATLVGVFDPPATSARSAILPDIVGEGDEHAIASTLGNASSELAVVLGLVAGGFLVAIWGATPTLILDAVTFAIAGFAAAEYLHEHPPAQSEARSWRAEFAEGVRTVFQNNRLRWLAVTTWIVAGALLTTAAVAVPFAHTHGQGALAAGLLSSTVPLGIVVGSVVLVRVCSPATAERLMLPAALATPVILAFTGFNLSTLATGILWFLAGVTGAMTVTAGRLFVLATPPTLRGRAFGVAVSGSAGAQVLASLAVGILAVHVGPARAVTDFALCSLALLVVFCAASTTFRNDTTASIPEEAPIDQGDVTMPPVQRRPDGRVWALNAVLVAAAAATAPLLWNGEPYASIQVAAWWVALLFLVGFAYPLTFEFRNHAIAVTLDTVPLVLGLLFLPPGTLVAIRTGAALVIFAVVRSHRALPTIFNTASTACSTLVAIAVFRSVVPPDAGAHPSVWPAIFAAVIAGELFSEALLTLVIRIGDQVWQPREAIRAALVSTAVTVGLAFLAVALAAALAYDLGTGWAITVFVVLAIAGMQTYQRAADRADALDRLYVVARELSPTATSSADLAPALTQLRRIVKCDRLELSTPSGARNGFATLVSVEEDPILGERVEITELPSDDGTGWDDPAAQALVRRRWLANPRRTRKRDHREMSSRLVAGERYFGILSATNHLADSSEFERTDQRLLDAAASQVAAALEKGRLVESLRRAATLDTLTGLANLDSLRSFLDTSLEGSAGGVLVLLNVDRFHEVNDLLGHDAGDAVLAEVARRIESAPTQGALIARVGGDQFALAIPGAAGSEVARLAGMAVKSRVDGSIRLSEVSADVRVRVGIARAPEHGSDSVTLLRRAEMALAAAKGTSSGIGEWEPDFERDGSRRLQLLTGLRVALSDGTLRVEFQPKLRATGGDVTGFEALVRWTHPDLGPISPAEFVPLAEATGLISALTSTVLRQALTTCRTWHDAGKPVGIAVNVSARSLDDDVLVGQVAAMLTASGIEPRWLTLEITESSVMEDHSRSLEVLRELRRLGVRLSIDDFGTGYSSLHQLRGLPVHEVKIDRSFVNTVDSNDQDRAVVKAVVELCDSLGLVTVAEGVETVSQAYALETLGVAQVQGYLHARPMTATAAMEWLQPRRIVSLASH
jgi:diguanylate cyclase (GGDEF)-like protein